MTHLFHKISIRRLASRAIALAAGFAAMFSATSCDSMIYEDQGDCDPHYKVRFVYDMNMKFADAFPNEVNEVTLYVIDDATGKIVLTKHESGEALRQDGYMMDIDVTPGDYHLVAWCGEGHTTSFGVSESEVHTGLKCSLLDRQEPVEGPWDKSGSHVRNDLKRLYHGRLETQNFPDEEGTYVYTVPLVKNTNNVHIVLQHLSGEPVDPDDFTFTISDENGLMDWDNTVLDDENLTYFAWHTKSGIAGVEVPDYTGDKNRAVVQVSAAVAELTTGRLMADHSRKSYVNIYNKRHELVVRIPLIDYLLLVKGEYNRDMSDQEYLDRQDDYSLVFFLDDGGRWMDAFIYINSWKVVLQDVDV